jgi:hypothetical protein
MQIKSIIFVGFKLTEAVETRLAACPPQDQIYLDDPRYLETLEIDGQRYIGKCSKDDIALDRLEDIARSVVSLLARVIEGWSLKSSEALVIAAEEEPSLPPGLSPDGAAEKGDDFDYSELVD